jgi:MFS family permease
VVAGGALTHRYTFFGVQLATDAAAASSMFLLMLLVGAIISSLAAGRLSDRFGRKPMIYLSGALQSIVMLAFIFSRSFEVAILMGIVFGLGYGAYNAVDWAMGADVLPSTTDYAKDMGVWHIAMTLPQSIATPIAGVLLDYFQAIGRATGQPTLGYTVIFTLAFIYFVLGTVLVRQVRGVR